VANPQRVFVGTSGWTYPHWRARFYPAGLPSRRWLAFLASRLTSVEINGTFYSLTTPKACERWRQDVPGNFVFAVKGSRYITHMKRLRSVRAALANFFASGILRLGSQLGPILWQLPPHLPFDAASAGEFLRKLPRDVRGAERLARRHDARVAGRAALTAPDGRGRAVWYAIEARHRSWMSEPAISLLSRWDVALVWADTAGEHPATTTQTTGSLAYVRLHGSQRIYEGHYAVHDLSSWARRARAWALEGTPVFVYFDNDRGAAAVLDAIRFHALLERGSSETDRKPARRLRAPRRARPRPAHFRFDFGRTDRRGTASSTATTR